MAVAFRINELHGISALDSRGLDHRLNVNGNNHGNNRNGRAFEIALVSKTFYMKTYKNLYQEVVSEENLHSAFKKARKHKTAKDYVINFERDLQNNILLLRSELLLHCYNPKPLVNFIVRDPKTRKISKSDFRDRIVHHALCNIIEPIFEKSFIFDSCANRKGKGTLKALQRFDGFKRKISKNNTIKCFVLKADIKKYFESVDHEILMKIVQKKIKDNRVLWLIRKILNNYGAGGANCPRQRKSEIFWPFFASSERNAIGQLNLAILR